MNLLYRQILKNESFNFRENSFNILSRKKWINLLEECKDKGEQNHPKKGFYGMPLESEIYSV